MRRQNVVVGVDGSECAQRALEAAVEVAGEGATVHVVSAYDSPSNRRVLAAYAAVPEEFTVNVDLLAEPRAVVEAASAFVESAGLLATGHFVDGDPASAILETAEAVGADLIVVGSRGLGRAAQVLRGSVSTKIAHHSTVDFLVVH